MLHQHIWDPADNCKAKLFYCTNCTFCWDGMHCKPARYESS